MLRPARYAGLAGAVLVAVAGFLGGALPELGSPAAHRAPALVTWFGGLALLVGAWWRLRDADPPRRWACTTAALWLLPVVFAPPVGSRDVYAYACQGWVYATGGDPYRDGVAACPWVDSVSVIWRDSPAPYGPLFLVLAGLAVKHGSGLVGVIVVLRGFAVAGVALTAACLPVLARRCGVPESRALWLALGCPLVGIHLVGGAHNDALMVGLMVAGLAVVARFSPILDSRSCQSMNGSPRSRKAGAAGAGVGALAGAGALFGLAVAIKATAVVVLPFAALAALAAVPRMRGGAALLGGAAAALLAVTYGSGLGFGWVGGLSRSGDSVQWTAPATAVGLTVNYAGRLFGADVNAVPVTRAISVVALAVVLATLGWRALERGDPIRHAGLALAATVALAPVFHPWYLTWPLAVLAATTTRTRPLATVAAAASLLVLSNGTALALYTKLPGALAMTALLVVLARKALKRAPHHVDVDQS